MVLRAVQFLCIILLKYIILIRKNNAEGSTDDALMHIIDNIPLERKQHTKFLGVFIDENLNWNQHIRHITNCISRNVGILYKTKPYLYQILEIFV